jgi:hypothetical protein
MPKQQRPCAPWFTKSISGTQKVVSKEDVRFIRLVIQNLKAQSNFVLKPVTRSLFGSTGEYFSTNS